MAEWYGEFKMMIEEAGFCIDHIYGSYDKASYEPKISARMMFVGRRPVGGA